MLILFTSSCKEKRSVDEIKVQDFSTLKAQFATPPAEYTTAPFFVWNADITREEIDSFLVGFRNQGSSQVFVHPRPGLVTEYLSDKWFELFRYTIDKGRELGMKVWIYDENSYPSGFAGGHVPAEMPESYNEGQGLKLIKVDMLPDTATHFFICLKEDGDRYIDITGNAAEEKGKTGTYYLFYKTYNGKSDWYGGFSYVDLLHKGVTEKFISVTMTGYEKWAGDEFGKTVPGTFTDEPQISSPGGIRYTPDLFEVFSARWGYDLKPLLPLLYEEKGDWKKVRHNYTSTLLDLFINRWAIPWYNYCEAKGLKFTGHYWEHEWPNMRLGGDNMAMYIYHQVPAVDMLFNQFNDSLPGAQFGNVRAIKELASAANQAGRTRKLSETYGGSGWDLTFTEMKRNGDWEYALGVNLMNQHLTYFTMAGARKYDYPPTFDYHEPWWNNYKYINDHYARLSLALSSGRQVNDILVLEPSTTSWLYDSYSKPNPQSRVVGQSFQTFITTLEKAQVEYDLGSERIIETLGSVAGGKLVVGSASYSTVIIPPLMENFDKATFTLLKKFVTAGGKLVAYSKPDLIDGEMNKDLADFYLKNSSKIIVPSNQQDVKGAEFLAGGTSFEDLKGGQMYHQTRELTDGKLVFIVNSSLDEDLAGTMITEGAEALLMNTLNGEISGYKSSSENGKVKVEISLSPAGSILLFIPAVSTGAVADQTIASTSSEVVPASKTIVSRVKDNALMIDFCDLALGGENFPDLHVFNAADKAFKQHGFVNGNPWNTSVQYKTNIVDRDTFKAGGFEATYNFTINDLFDYSGMRLIAERPWIFSVTVNGNEIKAESGKWWLDRSFGVYNAGKYFKKGVNKVTLSVSPMKVNAEIEPVYIIGDFSVVPAAKGWAITKVPASYKEGSWLEQGLPFYSWDMDYETSYNIEKPEGSYRLSLPDWKGTVSEVFVNGKKAGLIAFPPYSLDITSSVKEGSNTITVRVTGSLRNLQGPHHNNPPIGFSSPWNWRNVKSYPSGKEYKLYEYGLMKDFVLINSK
ncbi:MAG: glycosyl hydrolase [Bacteroidales bacterium]